MFVKYTVFTYTYGMKIIALLALCGATMFTPTFAALSQAAVPQPLPSHLVEAQWGDWTTSFLFRERTITIEVGDFTVLPTTELVIWETSRRHTWTNAVDSKRSEDLVTYQYFFDPTEAIIIKDRRANSPVWYGLAIIVTAIAMIGFYFIVKKRRTKDVSGQGQYPYHGN